MNPTAYSLDVDVSDGTGSGWSPAGFARKQSTGVVEQVSDQGDVWVFRFDAQGKSGGELRLTREQPTRDGWRIDIPVEVANAWPKLGRRLPRSGMLWSRSQPVTTQVAGLRSWAFRQFLAGRMPGPR